MARFRYFGDDDSNGETKWQCNDEKDKDGNDDKSDKDYNDKDNDYNGTPQ